MKPYFLRFTFNIVKQIGFTSAVFWVIGNWNLCDFKNICFWAQEEKLQPQLSEEVCITVSMLTSFYSSPSCSHFLWRTSTCTSHMGFILCLPQKVQWACGRWCSFTVNGNRNFSLRLLSGALIPTGGWTNQETASEPNPVGWIKIQPPKTETKHKKKS